MQGRISIIISLRLSSVLFPLYCADRANRNHWRSWCSPLRKRHFFQPHLEKIRFHRLPDKQLIMKPFRIINRSKLSFLHCLKNIKDHFRSGLSKSSIQDHFRDCRKGDTDVGFLMYVTWQADSKPVQVVPDFSETVLRKVQKTRGTCHTEWANLTFLTVTSAKSLQSQMLARLFLSVHISSNTLSNLIKSLRH